MDKKEKKTVKGIYELMVDVVIPIKEDVAEIKEHLSRLNNSVVKHEKKMDGLEENKIDKRPFIVMGGLLGLLLIILNIPQLIQGIMNLCGG